MTKAFAAMLDRDRGFNPHGVFALSVTLPFEQQKYEAPAVRAAALDDVMARVSRVPGVMRVGATNGFPGSALGILGGAMLQSANATRPDIQAAIRSASSDYFATMGVTLKAGRVFTPADAAGTQPVVIVNEQLARAMWPDGTAVGREIAIPRMDPSQREVRQIVGVVSDMKLGTRGPSDIFVPVAQRPAYWIDLVMRTDGDPAALETPVRRALREVNGDLLIENSTSIDRIISNSLGLQRAQATLATTVAILSAIVAGGGLSALLALAIAQRRREFGIRLALGSAPRALFWWIFARGMRLAVAGVVIGLSTALVLVRVLRSQVLGFSAASWTTYVSACAALLAIAAVALWGPSRRVLRTDPLTSMRVETE
jgi:hypothetical protein